MKLSQTVRLKRIAFLTLLVLAGCTKDSWRVIDGAPPPPPGSKVEITTIEPAPGTVLVQGDAVVFRATVQYTATTARAMLQLMAQDAERHPLVRTVEYVPQGQGTRHLELRLTVPASETVTVYAPLMNQHQRTTDIVASQAYRVRRKSD